MYDPTYSCTIVTISGIHEVHPEQFDDFELDDFDSEVMDDAGDVQSPRNNSPSHSIEKIRQKYPKAFKKWTADEDQDLEGMFDEGYSLDDLANRFQRTIRAILMRLHKLGCLDNLALNSLY